MFGKHKKSSGLRAAALVAAAASLTLINPSAAAAAPGPVEGTSPAPVWYPANGSAGENSTLHGTGPSLTWTGSPAYAAGAFGEIQSFSFDGTNGLDGGTTLGNLGTDAFYLSFDVRTTAAGPLPSELISKGTTCSSGPAALDISLLPDGTVHVDYDGYYNQGPTVNHYSLTSGSTVNDGAWHTVVVSQYGSILRIFVDGSKQAAVYVNNTNITNTDPFSVANGDACVSEGTQQPLVGQIDNIFLTDITQGGHPSADLSAAQVSTPTVAAGAGGSFDVDLTNPGSSAISSTTFYLNPPAGVTFTGVSGYGGQCSIVSGSIKCPQTGAIPLDPGVTTLTVQFTTDASAAPGTTLTSTSSLGLTNDTQADPNHYNDAWTPISVQIAPVPGAPMADPTIGAIALGGLVLLGGAGMMLRRRRRHAQAPA